MYLIASGFLFAVGQETSYGGWISSYTVLYGFSTKEHATFYSSLYWISITFFRFALAVVPGPPSAKVRNLAIIGILTTFLSVILIFHVHVEFGLIFTSILYGLTDSVLFPLLLTVPE
jgi:fucose permease